MKRAFLLAVAMLALAAAQAAAQDAVIYEGDAASGLTPLTLGGWGSGIAKEVSDESYVGARALRITTHGYYAGGRLDLQRPLDLSAFAGKTGSYVVLAVMPALPQRAQLTTTRTSTTYGAASTGSTETKDIVYTFPYPPGEEPPEASLPTGGQTAFRAERLRIVLQTDQGMASAEDIELRKGKSEDRGWVRLAVPFSFFKGKAEGKLQRVMLFANASDMFFLGELKLASEAPVRIVLETSIDPWEAVLSEGSAKVTCNGTASAGLAPLEIVWDFDSSDGLQEDAVGEQVTNYYYKAGEFTVTCTVKDLSGGQDALKRTMSVRIVKE